MYTEHDLKKYAEAAYLRGFADRDTSDDAFTAFGDWWKAFLEFQESKGEHILTVNEVAERMGVSRMTVYRMCHAKQIGHIVVGSSFRIPLHALTKYIEENTHDV